MDKLKILFAMIAGTLTAWLGDVWPLIAFVICGVVFDYITGVIAAGRERNINSQKATDGIYKKVGLLMLMLLGFGLDVALTYFAAEGLNFDLPMQLPFGLIVCAWIVINESISIIENLVRLEVPIPRWLVSFLKIAQDRLDAESGDT